MSQINQSQVYEMDLPWPYYFRIKLEAEQKADSTAVTGKVIEKHWNQIGIYSNKNYLILVFLPFFVGLSVLSQMSDSECWIVLIIMLAVIKDYAKQTQRNNENTPL